MRRQYPPREYLRECLEYAPETGALTWKERPREHFQSEGVQKNFNARFAGKPALSARNGRGYKSGNLVYLGKNYKMIQHIAIWVLVYGVLPDLEIDHIDSDGLNNKLSNLRLASRSNNMGNTKSKGKMLKGVIRNKSKFSALITREGKRHYLGTFCSEIEAHEAYQRGAKHHFGEFARFN